MMDEMPNIDVGTPPESDNPNVTMEWWSNALDELRDHMEDWIHAMIGSHTSTEARTEEKEFEEMKTVEVPNGNGGVKLEERAYTVEKTVVVDEKKVCHGHYIDVEITTENEKMAVMALANSAGLNVSERHGATRFTHRLE